jgi:DNA-binding NarL/FixJ family response regulator
MSRVEQLNPHFIIMNLDKGLEYSLHAIRKIKTQSPQTHIVIRTAMYILPLQKLLIEAGAGACISEQNDVLHTVSVCWNLYRGLHVTLPLSDTQSLTQDEVHLLLRIAKEDSIVKIALDLGYVGRSVERQLRLIRMKLNVKTTKAAIALLKPALLGLGVDAR